MRQWEHRGDQLTGMRIVRNRRRQLPCWRLHPASACDPVWLRLYRAAPGPVVRID
jgi:hypothetical protein